MPSPLQVNWMEVWLFDGARGLSTLMSKEVCWEELPQEPSAAMSRGKHHHQ